MRQIYQSLILTQIQDIDLINLLDSCKSIVKINLTKSKESWTLKLNDLFHINKNDTDNSIITDSIDINTFMIILNDIRENDWILNGSNAFNIPNTTKIIKTFYFQKVCEDTELEEKEKQDKEKEEKFEIYLRKKKYNEEVEMQRVLYEAGLERQKNKAEEDAKKAKCENLYGQIKPPVKSDIAVAESHVLESIPSARPQYVAVMQSVPPTSIATKTNSPDISSSPPIPTRTNSILISSSTVSVPLNIPPPPIRRRVSAVVVKSSPLEENTSSNSSSDIQVNSSTVTHSPCITISNPTATISSPIVTSPSSDNTPNAATQRRTLMSARIASLAAAKSARSNIHTLKGPLAANIYGQSPEEVTEVETPITTPIVSKPIVNIPPPPPLVKPITIPPPASPVPPVVVVNNAPTEVIKSRSKSIYNIGFQLPPPPNLYKEKEEVVESGIEEENLESKILKRATISQSRKLPTKHHFVDDDNEDDNINNNVMIIPDPSTIPPPTTPKPLLDRQKQHLINNINNESPFKDVNNDIQEEYKTPSSNVQHSHITPMSEVKSKNDEFFKKMKEEENLLKLQKQEEESKMDSVTLKRLKDEEEAKNKHDSSKTSHYAKLGSAFVPSKQSALASPAGRGGGRGRGRGIL